MSTTYHLATKSAPAPHLTRALIFLLAFGAAVAVANLYYCQPLLVLMAKTFHEHVAQMGLIPTLTQAGYAVGLLLLTPLGDVLPKRGLIVSLCLLCAAGLVAIAFSQSPTQLAVFSLLVGVMTIVPQIIVPLAADLAPEEKRGQIVGTVMGGLLLGVLAARTVSGSVGEVLGWRAMYDIAAVMMVALAMLMWWRLPKLHAHHTLAYGALLTSLWTLWREQPLLRQSSVIGGALFGAFSVLWTVLAFRLAASPYHFGSAVVGLFGLVGIAGALGAPFTGRIADRRGPYFMVGVGIAITLASYLTLLLGDGILPLLILGILALDFGIQSSQISNQARIYALVPHARSRVNSVYMVVYFIGGACGSALGSVSYEGFGWLGSCVAGIAFIAVAIIIHLAHKPNSKATVC